MGFKIDDDGFLDWRDRQIFFFLLVIMWWLFLVDVIVVGGF